MRLHLGCGNKYWPGFVNVDLETGDVKADVRKLPQENESCTEIHAIHLFEHLYRWEAPHALLEWRRVLKDGGKLCLEMPSLKKMQGMQNLTDFLLGMYGDPNYKDPWMTHKWAWWEDELREVLTMCGYERITFMEPFYHRPDRDMRVECFKTSTT